MRSFASSPLWRIWLPGWNTSWEHCASLSETFFSFAVSVDSLADTLDMDDSSAMRLFGMIFRTMPQKKIARVSRQVDTKSEQWYPAGISRPSESARCSDKIFNQYEGSSYTASDTMAEAAGARGDKCITSWNYKAIGTHLPAERTQPQCVWPVTKLLMEDLAKLTLYENK